MFIGTHYHTLDDKHRVSVPKSFREKLAHDSVITRGLDGCLFLFPSESWGALAAKLQTLPLTSHVGRDFLRLLTANAAPVEFDKLGRTHLPGNLLELAGITKEVVFVGSLTRVELWAKARYHAYFTSLSDQETKLNQSLEELGI